MIMNFLIRLAMIVVLTLPSLWARATGLTNDIAHTSTALPGWSPQNLIDGSLSVWSSSAHSDSGHREWLAFWWKEGMQPVKYVKVLPRYFGGTALGFPNKFSIYYSNGAQWIHAVSFENFAVPQQGDWLVFTLPEAYVANGIHIVANSLGNDGVGNYLFQVAEVAATNDSPYPACKIQNGSGSFILGLCRPFRCDQGFSNSGYACLPTQVSCAAEHASSAVKIFDESLRDYGQCNATSCLTGYALTGGTCVAVAPECTQFAYGVPELKKVRWEDSVTFGGQIIRFAESVLSWMLGGRSFQEYVDKDRQFAYLIKSTDCGQTWVEREAVNAFKISGSGSTSDYGNGVNHLSFAPSGNILNQAFMTYIDYGPNTWYRGRIYPLFIFDSRRGLEYQALAANQVEIYPIIGSPNLNTNDHFYSPWPLTNTDDPDRSVMLYFGGWRAKSNGSGAQAACNPMNAGEYMAPAQKDCKCAGADVVGADVCTGDKIFGATNRQSITGSSNKLLYKVYSMNGTFSSGAWDSILGNFEPMVWPALLNTTCSTSRCPYKLTMVNDPTVIRLKSGVYVMYFTGAYGPSEQTKNLTHLGFSNDGVHFSNFSILNKGTGGYFPYGLAYNSANGTAKAYYNPATDKIYLVSRATQEPNIASSHPDLGRTYVHTILGSDPTKVVETRRLNFPTGYQSGAVITSQSPF